MITGAAPAVCALVLQRPNCGKIPPLHRGGSSAGRAPRSQCGGRGFDPLPLHQIPRHVTKETGRFRGPFSLHEPISIKGTENGVRPSYSAVHPELLAPVLQTIHRVIATHLIRQAGVKRSEAATGAVTLIQRFGSAANLNIHLHALVLDGVYRTTGEGVTVFHPAPALTSEKVPALLDKIIARILRLLTRQGHLVEEEGVTYVADAHGIIDPENLLAPLQAASCTYRIAFGPRAGRKVLSWQYAARRAVPITQQLSSSKGQRARDVGEEQYSVHA